MTHPQAILAPAHLISSGGETHGPLGALVESARGLFASRYPKIPDQFDALVWETNPGRKPRERKANLTIRFEALAPEKTPWPARFALGVKAFLILEDYPPDAAVATVAALRYLWEAIESRLGLPARAFAWSNLHPVDFDRALEALRERDFTPGTRYSYACMFDRFRAWLEDNSVAPSVDWRNPLVDPGIVARQTHEGRKLRLNRLPTQAAIIGLADIYVNHAKDPADRLLICALGISLLTGFRIDELLTLPVDCLVAERQQDGRIRYGIRFFNKKSRGKKEKFATRWLSPFGAELAKVLIREIALITRHARARARALEEDPKRFPLPKKFEGRQWLTLTEARKDVLQVSINTAVYAGLRQIAVPAPREMGLRDRFVVARPDLERLCLAERLPLHVDLGHGVKPGMSELLFIIPFNFIPSGERDSRRRHFVRSLFVHVLSYQQVMEFIAGKNRHPSEKTPIKPRPSAFERFGITEPDGRGGQRVCRLRTHMLRHWLNTLANKSGMSAFQITLWMQRTQQKHTGAYLHSHIYQHSASDTADFVIQKLLAGEMWGQRAHDLAAIAQEERRAFLERTLRYAHVMAAGVCTADFVHDSCEVEKACACHCPYYLHTIGDLGERESLLTQKQILLLALERFHRQKNGGVNVHPRQVEFLFRYIAGIDSALDADDFNTGTDA